MFVLITSLFCFFYAFTPTTASEFLLPSTSDVTLRLNHSYNVTFSVSNYTGPDVELYFNYSEYVSLPNSVTLQNGSVVVTMKARKLVSSAIVEVGRCEVVGENETCPLNISEAFVRISVIESTTIAVLVDIVGWAYFFAWTISFYPQMWLNFKRKSVIGLNFDFLALNIIGFGAYSMFNLLMYFDGHVKEIYHIDHPRAPPPVLANDVVFAVHAFFACIVTALQCFIYERDDQRISSKCILLSMVLIAGGLLSATLALFDLITILAFVTSLSYIKMVVTCSKYFPQAIYNFQRKSTVGWSIGNVLLDFTGGSLDILQMVLQASNVADWSSFYGNPVKFGLGLVSIVFDIVFMLQHYVLYRNATTPHEEYSGIENPEAQQSPPPDVPDNYGTTEQPIIEPDDR